MIPALLIWLFASMAVLLSLTQPPHFSEGVSRTSSHFSGWTGAPLPAGLHAVPLSDRDRRFARDFPGEIAAFADGPNVYLARWVVRPTRLLHSSSDCLRGAGYAVEPGLAWSDQNKNLWATFTARRGGLGWRVKERIVAADGQTWTDVSAWYWNAFLSRSQGPWWAITWIEPES
jgi:hypothetical protein